VESFAVAAAAATDAGQSELFTDGLVAIQTTTLAVTGLQSLLLPLLLLLLLLAVMTFGSTASL